MAVSTQVYEYVADLSAALAELHRVPTRSTTPDTYSVANGEIMADFAVTQGSLSRDQADGWMADLRQLGREGRYFFSLNRYLFLANR